MKNKKIKAIKSQGEANSVRKYILETVIKVMDIDEVQANKRIDKALADPLLTGLHPETRLFQMIVEKHMQTPID